MLSSATDVNNNKEIAGVVAQWLDHRNDTSALQEAYRKDIVVDTTEIAARWSALPRIYEEGVAALKAVEGMWVASAHQSHSYTDGACVTYPSRRRRPADPAGSPSTAIWPERTSCSRAKSSRST